MNVKAVTDEEIEAALIKANGQPTKAAEILECSYTNLWKRIRENPNLQAVQKANRAKVFNECVNILSVVAKNGTMPYNSLGQDGKPTKDVEYRLVDERTRLSALQSIMNTFKADDGITDEVNINANVNQTGSISINKWIADNNEGK